MRLANKSIRLFDREVALAIGINESIVVQQIQYWLSRNEKANINYKEGRYWTFNSIKEWHEKVFYFWSESKVRRIFVSLEKMGILITNNFNKMGYDRTKWYSIDYEKLNDIVNEKLMRYENETIENDSCVAEEDDLIMENSCCIEENDSIVENSYSIEEKNLNQDSHKKKSAGILEKILAKMENNQNERNIYQNERNVRQIERNVCQNERKTCQDERNIRQNEMSFSKMDRCNLSK